RLEGVRLSGGERVELGRRLERERLACELLVPELADVVRSEDEVRALRERRDEILRNRVVVERRLPEVEAPFRGREDNRVLDRVQRALREGREGAHGLDRVAEELDSERLVARRRIHVDDAAANRELA